MENGPGMAKMYLKIYYWKREYSIAMLVYQWVAIL